MTGSPTPLADQLEALRAEEAAAHSRYQLAQAALREDWKISAELLTPWSYAMRRNEELSDDQPREYTDRLLSEIQKRGLVLSLDPRSPGHEALVVRDPRISEELDASIAAAGEARSARVAFEQNFAQSLAEEKSKAAAKKFAETLEAGESIEDIRSALEVS